ncbi:MAG: imidazole glycerol phosphate synthase subunit HisF [Microbacteriaceae bacterium]|nr:imidazole glycerol phosphate synthase subunit HisF [Microbacteriaceae bacterium]
MALSVRVIPCLDVADGRVVKGVNFENLRNAGDPIELSAYYYESGADELTFLDVNATHENRATMYELVTKTAEQVFIPLTVGGGIRTVEDVARLLKSGADKVSIASAAIATPSLITDIADRFGSQVLVLSLDAKRGASKSGFIATTHGGRVDTSIDAIDWIQATIDLGVGEILLNSIDADGTKQGFDVEMLEAARKVSTVPLIASGGAGSAVDFVQAARAGADAILAASIFHDRSVTIEEVKIELKKAGFETR